MKVKNNKKNQPHYNNQKGDIYYRLMSMKKASIISKYQTLHVSLILDVYQC